MDLERRTASSRGASPGLLVSGFHLFASGLSGCCLNADIIVLVRPLRRWASFTVEYVQCHTHSSSKDYSLVCVLFLPFLHDGGIPWWSHSLEMTMLDEVLFYSKIMISTGLPTLCSCLHNSTLIMVSSLSLNLTHLSHRCSLTLLLKLLGQLSWSPHSLYGLSPVVAH